MHTDQREYSISDVLRLLGVSRNWIIKREEAGVLPSPRRTRGGHRTYSTEELHQLRDLAAAEGLSLPGLPNGKKKPRPIRTRIAVLNQKGGVGKTTITQNLGLALASKGYKSLLLDLDRQFNLTTCFGVNIKDNLNTGLGYVLQRIALGEDVEGLVQQVVTKTSHPFVDLLPNNMRMFDAESLLRADHNLFNSLSYLDRAIKTISSEYSFTFIDCPPDLGILTANGIKASDAVLIPVDHDLSLEGLTQLRQTLDQVSLSYGEIPILGVVINKFDSRTVAGQYIIEKVEKTFPRLAFETKISQTTKIMESHIARTPLMVFEPNHSVAKQFDRLADEVIARVREEAQIVA
jgi:chromosome partitioning protein